MATLRLLLLLLACLLSVAPLLADSAPVVIAVDTSRSLTPDQLDNTTSTLAEAVAALPAQTPVGLIAFDDEPRWIRPLGSSPAEIARGLAELTPRGGFTLLHDAIFLATREMPDGGAIVLATDGRDENSATTIEDVARRCTAQGVRLITVGSGGRLEDRTLRRLALLTNGAYAGQLEGSGGSRASSVARQVTGALAEVPPPVRGLPAAQPEPVEATPAEPATPMAEPATTTVPSTTPFWAYGLGLLVLAGAVALALRSRRAAPKADVCPNCGCEIEPGVACPHCQDIELVAELQGIELAGVEELSEVTADTEAFSPLSFEERIERTYVLEEQTVLLVREPGHGPRSYSLPAHRAVSVGRDPGLNTLAVLDPTLSSRHFRLVPYNGTHYLLDLHSTNGCLVNGRRTRTERLKPGDVIRAGQIEFAIRTRQHQLGWENTVEEDA